MRYMYIYTTQTQFLFIKKQEQSDRCIITGTGMNDFKSLLSSIFKLWFIK